MADHNTSSENGNGKEGSLPPGWTKGFSRSQGRYYYCYPEAKHTQWHFPTKSEAADPRKAKERMEQNFKEQQRKKPAASASASSSASKRPRSDEKPTGLGDILSAAPRTAIAKTIQTPTSKRPRSSSSTPNPLADDTTCISIIVPFRDIHPSQNRAKHLSMFLPHMHTFLTKLISNGSISDYHIYIIEQSDDQRKFNRGKLLNIGFDLARKNKCRRGTPHDVFIFHDVDLLPGDDLGPYYAQFPKAPIHIARVWDRYSNNPKYFGGIVSFSGSDMKRINGYPNTFWGWGGEDDEMQNRCERLRIRWDSPRKGTITDLEEMNLNEKLAFLRSNRSWKCMVKWEALEEHEKTWRTNGLADLNYSVLKMTDLDEGRNNGNENVAKAGSAHVENKSRATKVTVDVKLNGNHWANDKCGIGYMGS